MIDRGKTALARETGRARRRSHPHTAKTPTPGLSRTLRNGVQFIKRNTIDTEERKVKAKRESGDHKQVKQPQTGSTETPPPEDRRTTPTPHFIDLLNTNFFETNTIQFTEYQ
ncbi:hypothetical protein AVEN_222999-1 [Araneus ventricosus]|uniref:Uncharacterized protein n=1 Tax=Araneus ventricosus TaxID=182803 RepID=A0A4Y2UVD2_ARAVE|nr:hypothetical protein AVEN_198576-1 [Araneus ventricosus]GBO16949.1 hypothetical protein AVEN_222999-1 [Araneus ventricosus]